MKIAARWQRDGRRLKLKLRRRVELTQILEVDGVEGAKPVDLDEIREVEDIDGGGVALVEHKKVAPVRVRRG